MFGSLEGSQDIAPEDADHPNDINDALRQTQQLELDMIRMYSLPHNCHHHTDIDTAKSKQLANHKPP
jgi:hypothetical protein